MNMLPKFYTFSIYKLDDRGRLVGITSGYGVGFNQVKFFKKVRTTMQNTNNLKDLRIQYTRWGFTKMLLVIFTPITIIDRDLESGFIK